MKFLREMRLFEDIYDYYEDDKSKEDWLTMLAIKKHKWLWCWVNKLINQLTISYSFKGKKTMFQHCKSLVSSWFITLLSISRYLDNWQSEKYNKLLILASCHTSLVYTTGLAPLKYVKEIKFPTHIKAPNWNSLDTFLHIIPI